MTLSDETAALLVGSLLFVAVADTAIYLVWKRQAAKAKQPVEEQLRAVRNVRFGAIVLWVLALAGLIFYGRQTLSFLGVQA